MMSDSILKDHPIQRLIFFVAQDTDDVIRAKVKRFLKELAHSREWVIRAPQVIDSITIKGNSGMDSSDVIAGGYLELYSAFPGTYLQTEIDRRHLEETEYLVALLCEFSQINSLAIEFELEGNFVGSIEDGVKDQALSEGLLGEWRRNLELPPL